MRTMDDLKFDKELCENILSNLLNMPRKFKCFLSPAEVILIRDLVYRKIKKLEEEEERLEDEEIGEFVKNGILELFEPIEGS